MFFGPMQARALHRHRVKQTAAVLGAALLLGLPGRVPGQEAVRYAVAPAATDPQGVSTTVHLTLSLPSDFSPGPVTLIMPRAIPMGYGRQLYDQFVSLPQATTRSGRVVKATRQLGPRWLLATDAAQGADPVSRIDYEVDLRAMEAAVLSGGDSSRCRPGYIALLGYSVFAYVDGLEARPVELTIAPPANQPAWPVFSTLAPQAPARPGSFRTTAVDFYGLADSQILIGPGFQVRQLKGTPPLFLAWRAEAGLAEDRLEPLAEQAYAAMINYFGTAPFPHYSLVFEFLQPLSARHDYGFAMEHMQSATFGAVAADAPGAGLPEEQAAGWRYHIAHHVAHAWIPKRCAGEGYFPFRWELAPLIDTIWFSEGFGQYAAADALSDVLPLSAEGRPYRDALVESRFRAQLARMPEFLREMPLTDVSRVASTVYAEDFRTGITVFARGGLMARDMDDLIREKSGGKKRLRDALRALVAWSQNSPRAFRIDELPVIFQTATGVDTRAVMDRWLAGMK